MKICDECQGFCGAHQHNAPYHMATCECDGRDRSRTPVIDQDKQDAVRLASAVDEATEKEGLYAFIRPEPVWKAVLSCPILKQKGL
jgi:hypothetical protein